MTQPPSCCTLYHVHDRGRDADDPDPSHSLDDTWIYERIGILEELDLDRWYVGVDRSRYLPGSYTRSGRATATAVTSARIPRKSSSDSDSRSPRRMRIRAALEAQYQGLYPLQLRRELDAELDRLWTLAAPDPHRRAHIEIATPSAKSAPWRLLDDAFGNPEF